MGIRTLKSLLVVMALSLCGASLAAQEAKIGGQAGFADDADFSLGPRAQISLGFLKPELWFSASFDYFFPDAGETFEEYYEMNGNLLYDVKLAGVTNLVPYAGAGLNFARWKRPDEDPETGLGLNLVGGFRFPIGGFTPFVEGKMELKGGGQLMVVGGILFP